MVIHYGMTVLATLRKLSSRAPYPVFHYAGFALLAAAIIFTGIALVALVNALSVIESRSAVLCVLPG